MSKQELGGIVMFKAEQRDGKTEIYSDILRGVRGMPLMEQGCRTMSLKEERGKATSICSRNDIFSRAERQRNV